jgi:hypothetical protein
LEYCLHLRQWQDLHPSMEFRCFIKDSHMIGVSQRHIHTYYAFLADMKDSVRRLLVNFYQNHVKDVFPLRQCK